MYFQYFPWVSEKMNIFVVKRYISFGHNLKVIRSCSHEPEAHKVSLWDRSRAGVRPSVGVSTLFMPQL